MKKHLLLWLSGCMLFALSCTKNPEETIVPQEQVDVFVAGAANDTTTSSTKSAVWKNGFIQYNQLSENNDHYAYAIALSGNDVYTTGYQNTADGWRCKVWKNGAYLYDLGDGICHGNGIAVDGSDVYVTGHAYESTSSKVYHYAIYWKNQIPTMLTDGESQAEGTSVVVKGEDVYIGGYEGNQARIWKNDSVMVLNNAAGCRIYAIFVDGSDVYAVGDYESSPSRIRLWKNGISTDITSGATEARATSIVVSDGDVYIAGRETENGKFVAKYWKNGTAVALSDGTKNSWAKGIAVKGNHVYVAGEELDINNFWRYAIYWKDGVQFTIGSKSSSTYGIAVK